MNAATLWSAYQEQGDAEAREELLTQNLRLVHHVARQLMGSLSVQVEFSDLISAGTIGLINAIDNFDPSRGLAFSTFAAPRIRGAILDDLRRWDHMPRSIRRKQRQMNQAQESLRGTLDRAPNDAETARELGVDVDTLWRWQSETNDAAQVSLDAPVGDAGSGGGRAATPLDLLVGESGEAIEDLLTRREEVELLRDALLELPERERLVLSLYYYEELKLHEIATILELTESRISQIRSKSLKTLRSLLASLREERQA